LISAKAGYRAAMTHAIRFARVRGPEVLGLAQVSLPEPSTGEALARQRVIGY
jgi:hypothetical protein